MARRSPLVCSMRRAIPYPCCDPIASSVFNTISASVPCHTSVLSPTPVLLLGSNKNGGMPYWLSIGETAEIKNGKRAHRKNRLKALFHRLEPAVRDILGWESISVSWPTTRLRAHPS